MWIFFDILAALSSANVFWVSLPQTHAVIEMHEVSVQSYSEIFNGFMIEKICS